MGIIKRYIRRQSARLLSKLGAQPHSAQRLVLNAPLQEQNAAKRCLEGAISPSTTTAAGATTVKGAKSKRAQRRQAQQAGALLAAAAKNHLPPVRFHQVHGPNARLSESRFVARRTQSFCHALVFSDRTIQPNERVYVKVLELAKGWSGTIRFGFTRLDPATLLYQMPKHACPDMTNAGHTWARALADEVVRRNSVIHFSYNPQGFIHYGINNQDCGVFQATPQLPAGQHLWFVVDIYGLTAAVELVDPRLHRRRDAATAGSPQELTANPQLTMFKATGAMEEVAQSHRVGRVKKRRKMRRAGGLLLTASPDALDAHQQLQLQQQQQQLYAAWSPENIHLVAPPYGHHQQHHRRQPLLPNLSSALLPAAQQNIYSPMPQMVQANGVGRQQQQEDRHDYYQIMTGLRQANPSLLRAATSHQYLAPSSALVDTTTTTTTTSDDQLEPDELEELEQSELLRRRLESSLHLSENLRPITTSTPAQINKPSTLPTPAARRKLAQRQPQAATTSSTTGTPKTPKPAAASARDSSGQPSKEQPPSKDCPICFERPINCVLYQCGHMCTCYECGVKQWRTQSRTCPICRTVIKDVIKTYMS